jgi:hypothetical protein
MKAAVLRFRTTENPRASEDRCAGRRPWIIENEAPRPEAVVSGRPPEGADGVR